MIGDTVTLESGQISYEYTVTGFAQGADNYGLFIMINEDGATHLGFECNKKYISIMVENSDPIKSVKVVESINDTLGDRLLKYYNYCTVVDAGYDSVIVLARIICIILVVVSLVVIWLTMMLLIRTIIIKKRRELGIKKALGFTSGQLRTELSLSMFPPVLIGISIGAVVGILNANRIIAALLSAYGVAQSNLSADSWMISVVIIGGVAVAYIMIYALSHGIKKISAYSLITE